MNGVASSTFVLAFALLPLFKPRLAGSALVVSGAIRRCRAGSPCHQLTSDISFRAERARQRIYEAVQAVGQHGGSSN